MKKLLFLLALVIICLPVMAKINNVSDVDKKIAQFEQEETLQKVGDDIYFDTKSVKNDGNGTVQGIFKQYNTNHDKFKKKLYVYALADVEIYCGGDSKEKQMEFPNFVYYNAKEKVIGEYNAKEEWKKEFPGGTMGSAAVEDIDNGTVYYDTLNKYCTAK